MRKVSSKSILKFFGVLSPLVAVLVAFQNCGSYAPLSSQNEPVANGESVATGLAAVSSVTGGPAGPGVPQTPVGSHKIPDCSITGKAGQLFLAPTSTMEDCASQCQAQKTSDANVMCVWNTVDITPMDACRVVGGDGSTAYSDTVSRGVCSAQCLVEAQNDPNVRCQYGSENLPVPNQDQ